MTSRFTPTREVARIQVTQEQFNKIEDAWYLASYPSGRRATGYYVEWFAWAVEVVTGIKVGDSAFSLEVVNV